MGQNNTTISRVNSTTPEEDAKYNARSVGPDDNFSIRLSERLISHLSGQPQKQHAVPEPSPSAPKQEPVLSQRNPLQVPSQYQLEKPKPVDFNEFDSTFKETDIDFNAFASEDKFTPVNK